MFYLKFFNTHSEYESYIESDNVKHPNICLCNEEGDLHYDLDSAVKAMKITSSGENDEIVIKFAYKDEEAYANRPNFEYSYDGAAWTELEGTNFEEDKYYLYNSIIFGEGKKVFLRGNNPNGLTLKKVDEDIYHLSYNTTMEFISDGVYCYGSIMNLLSHDEQLTEIPTYGCFLNLFKNCDNLLKAPELPASGLKEYCYAYMFQGCTSLADAPALPTTSLDDGCYRYMFSGCTSLTGVPELPAETMEVGCYRGMFADCTSLTEAPVLHSITLQDLCYSLMFANCTSLTVAPELPAATMCYACYQGMFSGCTALIESPVLRAPLLKDYCYNKMFDGCSSLNKITMLATSVGANDSLYEWVNGVSPSGVFNRSEELREDNIGYGISGIPLNWQVEPPYEE